MGASKVKLPSRMPGYVNLTKFPLLRDEHKPCIALMCYLDPQNQVSLELKGYVGFARSGGFSSEVLEVHL